MLAPAVVAALGAMPAAFVAVLAGLGLLKALTGAFATVVSGADVTAPLLTFLVSSSGVDPFGLGVPFWGLVVGVTATWVSSRRPER